MDRREFLIGGTAATAGMATRAAYAQNKRPPAPADKGSVDADVTANQIRFVGGTGVLNLVDDFGGSVTAWTAYYTAQGTKQTLFIPPGTYDLSAQPLIPAGPGAVVIAWGANCLLGGLFPGRFPGHLGTDLPMGRFASVSAGANIVVLADYANCGPYYPAGTWVCVMGFDTEFDGYPPSNQFFEFKQVKDMNLTNGNLQFYGTTTNVYRSTWPLNKPGSATAYDCGGPASLFPMPASWDCEIIVRGMNITNSQPGQELTGAAKNILFEDCNFEAYLPAPSGVKNLTLRRCTTAGTATMTVGKCVERIRFDKCTSFARIETKSSSVNEMYIQDCEVQKVGGVGQKTRISGSVIDNLQVGITARGSSRTLIIENSHITNFEDPALNFLLSDFTSFANGTFTLPAASRSAARFLMVPGAAYYFDVNVADRYNLGACFRIIDVTKDGSGNWIYKTTLADPIPLPSDADLVTGWGSSTKRINVLPTTSISVTNSFGCQEIEMLSKGPKGRPLYSYYYSGMVGGWLAMKAKLWGRIEKIVVTVHRPYTGVQRTLDFNLVSLGSGAGTFIKRNYGLTTISPKVNAKVAGTRVIDITDGTAVVDETDTDLLPLLDGLWHAGLVAPGCVPNISAENPSNWPIIEMEVWTNQGPETGEPRNRWYLGSSQ